jgi:hypothetical protein
MNSTISEPENKKQKYTFIHPTKSGGTAVEQYFMEHYNDYITGTGHSNICSNTNNPIIIVRDVKSRFFSMFHYWKNGNNYYIRDHNFKKKYESYTILDFIKLLKENKEELYIHFTWNQHFNNTTDWIKNTKFKNIIIIRYTDDLNLKIQQLINYLDIPNKNIPLSKINVSIKKEENLYDTQVDNFIEEYFKNDIQLLAIIDEFPEYFKIVI